MTEIPEIQDLDKKTIPPLYYKFNDYEYRTESKERVLSGIDELDYLTNGFELGCITIWTGQTNARKNNSNDNVNKANNITRRKSIFL